MPTSEAPDLRSLHARIHRLERRLRRAQGAWLGTGVALLALLAASAVRQGEATPAGTNADVLRIRGLVIEDAQGRPRLLLGAPVPRVDARKRRDEASGLVLLSPDGIDRVQIGAVGGPQMGGVVQERVSPATGLMVNGPDGDERGGFGAFENGQVGWGLDFEGGGEALVAAVMPEGFAGLILSAEEGEETSRVVLLTTRDGQTSVRLSDAKGNERAVLAVDGVERPTLQVLDESGDVLRDAFAE